MTDLSKITLDEPISSEDDSTRASDSLVGGVTEEIVTPLYRRWFGTLVAGLRSTYGVGPPDPEEVANYAFLKLSERNNLSSIKDLEAYIWVVAHNRMRAEFRSLRVREAFAETTIIETSCDEFNPERVLGGKQEVEIVNEVLKGMSERRRGIFIAARIDGLTPAKAGTLYGVGRTAAMRHIAVATAEIAQALADGGDQ